MIAEDTLESAGGDVLLRVRVQPKSSRNAFLLAADGRLRVALQAPPVDGAANKALVAFVADQFSLPRRQVRLERGEKGREKLLRLEGVTRERVLAVLLKFDA